MTLVKTQNAEGGSDARYDVSQMTPEERQHFDDEGRPLGSDYAPDQWVWTDGIIGARGGWGPSGPPGGGGGAGSISDPYYQQMASFLKAEGAADLSSTKAALQQMLIAFGLVPEGFKDQLGALDDTTRALIQKNTDTGISAVARMREALQKNNTGLVRGLNASGMLRSGAKGAGLRENQLGFDRTFQDALSSVLGEAGGMYSRYASGERQRQLQLLQLLSGLKGGGGGGGGGGSKAAPAGEVPKYSAAGWQTPGFQQKGGTGIYNGTVVPDDAYHIGNGIWGI